MGQKPDSGMAFGDQLHRQRSNFDRRPPILDAFTVFTGIFIANMALDPQPGRDVIELLADLLTKTGQLCPAGALFLILAKIVDDVDARQILWQGLAPAFFAAVGADQDFVITNWGLVGAMSILIAEQKPLVRMGARLLLTAPAEQLVS